MGGFPGGQAGTPLCGGVTPAPRGQEAAAEREVALRKDSALCLTWEKHPIKEGVNLHLGLLVDRMGNHM